MTAVTTEDLPLPYRDPAVSVEDRVADLLSRMTVAEKIAQLGSVWVFSIMKGGELVPAELKRLMGNGIGQITRVSGASSLGPVEAARIGNDIQRFLQEETRLGIPAIIHEEVCAGLMARHATVFPQAIGVASTWDPYLTEQLAAVVRREMLAVGARQGLSPVLDVCRDPRWGRTEETFGEDPHLVAIMGSAFVRGLQGDDLANGVIATAKHFVGYGASEGGMNWAPARIPDRELHDVYLHPFAAAVHQGLRSVMTAYHELDGVPSTADHRLFTTLLRETWGFDGCVVSDYFAIRQLVDYHALVADGREAAAAAIGAGVDVELPGTDCYGEPLAAAVASGAVEEQVLDRAVSRVLKSKFELGLFDRPFVDEAAVGEVVASPAHRVLARNVADKSMVLLKNDGILPLAASSRIAVIGPNAHQARHLFGDYSYPAHIESLGESANSENVFSIPLTDGLGFSAGDLSTPTVWEEFADRLGSGVAYSPGCDVNTLSREGFAEAVELARRSDVAIMVMGDKAGLTEDCTSGEGRDRSSLDLPGVQEELIKAVEATGTPVVLVLVAGRPTGSAWVHEHCGAVVMAWLPGREGAAAIVDLLLGVTNPGGKLPISFPRSAGQVPVYHGHKISGNRSNWRVDYVDSPAEPLYPFGHGLSYTSFQIGKVSLGPAEIGGAEAVTVTAEVANTGDREGDEVLQVYTRDLAASVTRPVSELKAFARLTIPPGESRTVIFEIGAGQLGFHDREGRYLVEPGEFEVYLGTSARDRRAIGRFTVIGDAAGAVRSFAGKVTVQG
jgi:beta-glucosidase